MRKMIRYKIRILRYWWEQIEREYLKATAKNRSGMRYEKTPIRKGK